MMGDWIITAPAAVMLVGAVIGVLFEAFIPASTRRPIQVVWSLIVTIATAGTLIWRASIYVTESYFGANTLEGSQMSLSLYEYMETPVTLLLQLMLVFVAILSILVMADRTSVGDGAFASETASEPGTSEESYADRHGRYRSEIYPLTLFSVGGMMIFVASPSLLTMFVALEVLSLPLYILAATARRRRLLSQEAALKYFILGAFASAFFLMGSALYYGTTQSISLLQAGNSLHRLSGVSSMILFVASLAMILVGLLFKVGAAPFHAWTPDVYTGAPTPVTGFMAAAVKIAAFGAIFNVLYVLAPAAKGAVDTSFEALAAMVPPLRYFLYVVVILTIVVGTVVGMVQGNIKRMIAYSSIAHAGFILIAYFSSSQQLAVRSVLFYLAGYAVATIGAFALVTLVRETDRDGNVLGEATNLEQWKGLGRKNPWIAGAMLLFLLSFAGIPLTAGFMGKFLVFSAGIQGGAYALVVLAIVASVATAFFYFRLTVLMFFHEPAEYTVTVRSRGGILFAVATCAFFTILLGVLPSFMLGMLV